MVAGSTAARFARERPGGTRRTGEALFATSTTLEYVFPQPCRFDTHRQWVERGQSLVVE